MKRLIVTVVMALVMSFAANTPPTATVASAAALDPALSTLADPHQLVDVLVVLKSQADLSTVRYANRADRLAAVTRILRTHAAQSQRGILQLLNERVAQQLAADVVPLWISNEIAVRATPAVISELAARPDVRAVRPQFTVQAPPATSATGTSGASTEPNMALVNAPAMWSQGLRGQGIVVANMDTGVDATHPDLAGKWRGGTNSWYDPNGQHSSTPTDGNGHGTQTMGVMVGGDAGGSSIGMAPDAKWIAVKIFNDRGVATSTGIHLGFQWLLDPDGNPATADAPNVVNDSWTMSTAGCNLEFQPDLRGLRAAGILPVFAAGNDGPMSGTVFGPANNPEAFAVGGTDNADAIYAYSSRGPSACAGSIAPDLAAPGVSVRTSDIYGGYAIDTGTSVSAPHVSGALALLLGAFPNLSADRQEAALESGAVDLGAGGLDNDFGYGRLDVLAAYQWLAVVPDFTVAASPSSASTQPGGSVSYSVWVAGSNGFTGDVLLSLAGLSATQASWTFSPAEVSGGSGTAQLSVTSSSSIAPGSYPLTVTGTSGSNSRSTSVTLVIPAPPDFTVTATPSSQSTPAGGTAVYTIAVGSMNGFTGDVVLSLIGLRAEVGTAAFTPAFVTTAGSSQLTITTPASASPGSYPLTITGTSGPASHSVSVTLIVTPPPDFSIAATPSTQTVSAGSTAGYTVTLGALNGFSGNIALSLNGLPSSVGSASFTPAVVTGSGSSQLAVTTVASAPAGSYPLTIVGSSGPTSHTVSVTLVVSVRDFSLSSSPSTITVYRGQTASYAVSVSSLGGFTGSVSLSVSGLTAGSSASFSVNPVAAPGTSTLKVRTTGSTSRGTFTIRITGKNGSLQHQATVTLIVR
jgi:subtilisin family serine protease